MKRAQEFNLGIMFRREHAPEHLPDFARQTEEAGFDELWVVEDCFYGSGIAAAATALACTGSITVGLGIMPAVVRNPVFAAMEIATLARMYPGRFLPGIGHGVTGWMRQIGAFPKSQLKALEEVTVTVRRLLAGENVTFDSTEVHLNQAQLVFPPQQPPPISLGVRGTKSLALSGRVADGTILAEFAAPEYVSWAREQIMTARQEAGLNSPHRLTVFASAIAADKIDVYLAPLGILPQVQEFMENGGQQRLEAEMPDTWIDKLAVVGRPEDCVVAIQRLVEAGANTVVLVPLPGRNLSELDVFARHLLA